jgi:hypothetical protein
LIVDIVYPIGSRGFDISFLFAEDRTAYGNGGLWSIGFDEESSAGFERECEMLHPKNNKIISKNVSLI